MQPTISIAAHDYLEDVLPDWGIKVEFKREGRRQHIVGTPAAVATVLRAAEAVEAFSKASTKFYRHLAAYERKGEAELSREFRRALRAARRAPQPAPRG